MAPAPSVIIFEPPIWSVCTYRIVVEAVEMVDVDVVVPIPPIDEVATLNAAITIDQSWPAEPV